METGSCSLSAKEAELKVQLMVDCMKYHLDDVECLKKSLLSLASLCSSHDNVKDYLRENGCLQFILNLFTSCENTLLKETTLFCLACAVDQNVYSQRYIISQYIFDHIHNILHDKICEKKLHQTAAFVISCIAANNSVGQLNCQKSSCLIDLIDLFRDLIPKEILSGTQNNIILGNATFKNADLFTTICNAICASVNNPRNEENQDLCAKFLLCPSLLLIQRCPQLPTVQSILNLMAVLLAGNTKNQDKMRELDGIHVLCDLLRSFTTSTVENIEFLKMAVTVTSTLDSCLLDNVSNSEQFGSCGGIKYLVNLLHFCGHKHSDLLQVILTVAHATDSSSINQRRFTECGGLAVLVPLLSQPIEEELMAAVKYVLQICVPDGSSQTKTITDNYDTDNESCSEDYQPMKPGWLSEKLESILHQLDNIENGGYKAPSVVVSSDLKALTNKEKIEKEEEIQRTDGHKKIHQTEEEEEEEAEDNELSENSYIEASQSLQSTMQSKSEKLKSIDAKQPFKKNLPVTSEMNSKSGVKETTQMRNVTSVSVFSEFDINLTAKAKSYKNPQNESSTISRYNVPNCLADNKKKGLQSAVSNSTANACISFKDRNTISNVKDLPNVCPGGVPPNMNGKLLLTSKTYNKIIESNPNVCSYHRQIRKAEREWIRSAVKNSRSKWWTFSPVKQVPKSKDNFDVFDYISSSSELKKNLNQKPAVNKGKKTVFSLCEERRLERGVKKFGPRWTQIWKKYKFGPDKIPENLRSKWRVKNK